MFTFLPGPFLVQFSGPFYLSTDSHTRKQEIIGHIKEIKLLKSGVFPTTFYGMSLVKMG